MPHQVSPYYSKTGVVYHIYGVCTAGSAIKKERESKERVIKNCVKLVKI